MKNCGIFSQVHGIYPSSYPNLEWQNDIWYFQTSTSGAEPGKKKMCVCVGAGELCEKKAYAKMFKIFVTPKWFSENLGGHVYLILN